jgi:GrpB-like predicted nucleotidyltransferase (UPF0157 family)
MQNKITLKPYQTSWKSDYELWIYELSQILELCEHAQFEHMGSTAVPGLLSKPIIDILLGVDRIEHFSQKNIHALEKFGFDYVPILEEESPYRKYFQLLNQEGDHQVHLHIVTKHGNFWHQHLLFRNYLLKHLAAVQAYALIKQQALDNSKTRDNYTAAKTAFIFNCLRKSFCDPQLNPPLKIEGNLQAFQPQSYMTNLVSQRYSDLSQLSCDLIQWDREGSGALWWLDADNQG